MTQTPEINDHFIESAAKRSKLTDYRSIESGYEKLELTDEQKYIYDKLLSILDELKESFQTYGSDFFEERFERGEENNIECLKNFLSAVNSRDLKKVLNFQSENGMTILHDVADFHHEMTELLLNSGADPNVKDEKGKTPLHYAAEFNCFESIKMLLKAGANHDLQNEEGDTPLHLTNNSENIEMLLNAKANPSIPNKHGTTPLHIAAQYNYQENAQLLLKQGADPNAEDNEGNTPFYLAITSENAGIVELFLENNRTNINLLHEKTGEPPIFDAIVTKTTGGKIADLIIENEKVDLTLKGQRGVTILHRAASMGQRSTIQLLLQQGASANDVDDEGNNPLHYIIYNNHKFYGADNKDERREFDYDNGENIVAMISSFVSCHVEDLTALINKKMAEWVQDTDIDEEARAQLQREIHNLELEREAKAKKYVNTKNQNGNTPLFFAIESGNHDVINTLLEKGAEIIVTDEKGAEVAVKDKSDYTLYHYAVKNKDPEILKLLLLTPLEGGEIINRIQHSLMQNNSQEFSNLDNFVKQYNCLDMATYITERVLPSISHKDNNKEFIGNIIDTIFPSYMKDDRESYEAIKTDVSKVVESVVKTTNARLSVLDKEGNTLLHHAVKWGCGEEILDFLVKNGVDINAKNHNGVRPIHIAAKYGKLSQMQCLRQHGADLNAICDRFTASETDILGENFVHVQGDNKYASSTVSVKNHSSYEKATPTFIAADNLNADAVHMFISEEANPNIPNKIGATPLHVVAARILNRDYEEHEMSDVYAMFEGLALSSTDNLLHCKKLIEILDGDEKEREKLNEILNAVDRNGDGNTECTAPVEKSAPLPDKNFYHEVGSHIKEVPDLYLDHSGNAQAPPSVKYNINEFDSDHRGLVRQREVTAKQIEHDNNYGVGQWNLQGDHIELQRQREVTTEEIVSEWAQELRIRQSEWGEEGDCDKLSGAKESWEQNKDNATSSLPDQNHEQTQPIDINHKEASTMLSDSSVQEVGVVERSYLEQTKLIKREELKLNKFLNRISKAQNMLELDKIVDEALKAGVRINSSQDNRDSFTDCVIKKICELKGAKESARITSDIACKLTSKGAIFNASYKEVNEELVKSETFKDHNVNLQKANKEFCRCITKFQDIAKNSISEGRLKSIEINNCTFFLEYSEDSIVDVAKIIDGARSLEFNQGDIALGSNVVKIGESKVEVETENGIRNYTNISDGSNIVLTFPTSLGELEVRLYPDTQNEWKIKVEISDKDIKKFDHLKDKEEIGKNCLIGGLSVCEAIKRGCVERSGSEKLQASETINPSVQGRVGEIVKGLNHNDITEGSWVEKTAPREDSNKLRKSLQKPSIF